MLGVSVKSLIRLLQKLNLGNRANTVTTAQWPIANGMIIATSLRLNNHNRYALTTLNKYRTSRQTNIYVSKSNLLRVLNIKNRCAILHVLLNCNTPTKARRLLPSL